jgi:ABC-type phosphate transport system substrate-binding protein
MLFLRTHRTLALAAVIASVALAACGSSSSSPKPAATSPAPAAQAQTAPAATTPPAASTPAATDDGSSGSGSGSSAVDALAAKCKAESNGDTAQFAICLSKNGASLDDPKTDACMKSAKSAQDVQACIEKGIAGD